MITLTIDGQVHLDGASDEIKKPIKKALSLANPLHDKLKRMGNLRALYACPSHFKYYAEYKQSGRLSVGRGVLSRLRAHLRKSGLPFTEIDNRTQPPFERPHETPIELRSYQIPIVNEIIKHEYGVIKLGTGHGKTIESIEVARRLGTRTLFIVPREHLFQQFRDRIQLSLFVEPGLIRGKDNSVKDFTVGTWMGVQRELDRDRSFGQKFGTVVVDECHTAITKQRSATLSRLSPTYLYGLSASPRRTDKQDEAIFFTFGPIIVEAELEQEKPTVEVIRYHKEFGHWEYHEIAKSIAEDEARNQRIGRAVLEQVLLGRRVLILTKRIVHANALADLLMSYRELSMGNRPPVVRLTPSKGATSVSEFEALRNGVQDFSVIVGTFSLLSVGVDLPSLDCLVIAGDLRSDVLTQQSVGRIMRLFQGKQSPLVIDIADTGNGLLYNQFKARRKFYVEQGWNVKDGP